MYFLCFYNSLKFPGAVWARDRYALRERLPWFPPDQLKNLPEKPLPDPNWLGIRNLLGGICGSDLHCIEMKFEIADTGIRRHGTGGVMQLTYR
jgi:hypothetical protein